MIPTSLLDTTAGSVGGVPLLLLLVKATILLLAALGVTIAMRRASAGARHLVWLVALGSLMVLPAIAAWGPVRVPVLAASVESGANDANALSTIGGPPPSNEGTPAAPTVRHQSAAPTTEIARPETGTPSAERQASWLSTLSPAQTVFAAWAAIALACLLWLAHGTWSVHRIVRRSTPLSSPDWQTPLYEIADRFQLDDAPRILRSTDVKMPFACGVLRPTIVLPAESDGWSTDRRYAVLLHELGHVRRRDLLGHTLGRFACAVYWFHPLVWTAARRLRAESERACDDLALVCGARASDYAEHLLDIVAGVRSHHTPSIALAMAHRKEFEGRMLAILDPELRRSAPSRAQASALTAGLAFLSLLVGAATPVARRAEAMTVAAVPAPAPVAAPAPAADAERTQSVNVLGGQTSALHQDPNYIAKSIDKAIDKSMKGLDKDFDRDFDRKMDKMVDKQVDKQMTKDFDKIGTAIGSDVGKIVGKSLDKALSADVVGAAASGITKGLLGNLGATGNRVQDDERARLLAQVLRSDSSAELRRVAAWGLAQHAERSDTAVGALVTALRRDQNATVREMSAWALGEIHRSDRSAAALIEALKDADSKVRATAVWALGEQGDEDALEPLAAVLTNEDENVRRMAAWAIGQIEPSKAPKALTAALTDKERSVRIMAAWAHFHIEDPETVPAIDAALQKETDNDVRKAQIRALAAMGDKSIDAIKRLLDTKDQEVRSMAIRALAGTNSGGPWPMPMPRPRPYP